MPPILETVLYVDDLDAAERFYAEVIGLEVYSRAPGRHVFFRAGAAMLLLFDPQDTREQDLQIAGQTIPAHGPRDPGSGHIAFTMQPADRPAWQQRLNAAEITIESVVHWPGGGESLYFRDPAGNCVELATRTLWFNDDT